MRVGVNSIVLLLSVSLAPVFYAAGDYYSKYWAADHGFVNAAKAVTAYALSSLGWLGIMYTTKDIFVPSVLWQLMCLVVAVLLGLWWFKEEPTRIQWVGIALAVPAVSLIVLGSK